MESLRHPPPGASVPSPAWPRPAWLRRLDLDAIFPWLSLILLPAYVLFPGLKSLVFVLYAILFVLKVWQSGYVRSGLEIWFVLAILGLMLSAIGAQDPVQILRASLQTARTLCLPLLMCQYRPVRNLETALAVVFSGLVIYGLARMAFAPLVTGYAADRPYCFSNFFMHSSVMTFAGYLFFLVLLFHKEGRGWRAFNLLNLTLFAVLLLWHGVRASYLAALVVTPLILWLEVRKQTLPRLGLLLLAGLLLAGGVYWVRPAVAKQVLNKVTSMTDSNFGSNRGRQVIWAKARETFAANPVNGIGYRRFNKRFVELDNREFDSTFWHGHSEIYSMLAEIGALGTLLWLTFKIRLLTLLWSWRRLPLGAFLFFLLVAFEIHNLFETYLFERTAYVFIYLLLGLGCNQMLQKSRTPTTDPIPGAA